MSEITAWKQAGTISLWHYTENERNYPGWHLTGDRTGCASLATLLRAFEKLAAEAHRTVAVSTPNKHILAVPNNRGGRAAFRAPSKWRITYLPDADKAQIWQFSEQNAVLELTLGNDALIELLDGIEGVPAGKGDYSIGLDGNEPLWFWRWPNAV